MFLEKDAIFKRVGINWTVLLFWQGRWFFTLSFTYFYSLILFKNIIFTESLNTLGTMKSWIYLLSELLGCLDHCEPSIEYQVMCILKLVDNEVSYVQKRYEDSCDAAVGYLTHAWKRSSSLLLCFLHLWNCWCPAVGWIASSKMLHQWNLPKILDQKRGFQRVSLS